MIKTCRRTNITMSIYKQAGINVGPKVAHQYKWIIRPYKWTLWQLKSSKYFPFKSLFIWITLKWKIRVITSRLQSLIRVITRRIQCLIFSSDVMFITQIKYSQARQQSGKLYLKQRRNLVMIFIYLFFIYHLFLKAFIKALRHHKEVWKKHLI